MYICKHYTVKYQTHITIMYNPWQIPAAREVHGLKELLQLIGLVPWLWIIAEPISG